MKVRLSVGSGSDAGRVRDLNEDHFLVRTSDGSKGNLFLVADGMGGHQKGEIASQLAADIVAQSYYRLRGSPPDAISAAIRKANDTIYNQASTNPDLKGMGTTLTALVLDRDNAIVAHIGDSRAYLVRNGTIQQITRDHSWVAERVRQGLLTPEEAKNHRWRNVITNALGSRAEVRIDMTATKVQAGDLIVLCTDGLPTMVPDDEIRRVAAEFDPPQAVETLIREAVETGGQDNITVVVVRIEEVPGAPARSYDLPPPPVEEAARNPFSTIVIEPDEIPLLEEEGEALDERYVSDKRRRSPKPAPPPHPRSTPWLWWLIVAALWATLILVIVLLPLRI